MTEHLWIWLVLLYGLLRGTRDVIKKRAMQKSPLMEVLFFYTFLSLVFVSYEAGNAIKIDYSYFGLVVLKSFMVFLAWICSFTALRKLPVSFFGVIELSSVLFATTMGVLFIGESMTFNKMIGTSIVMLGLLLLNLRRKTADPRNEISFRNVLLALCGCLFSSTSGVLDKVIMKHMSSGQLQFWFMLMLTLMYLIFVLVKRIKIDVSCLWKNPLIIVMAVLFVVGDRALFLANGMPQSQVTVITLVKRCSCFVTILGGALFFKEKNILYRFACGLVIMSGIIIGLQ